MTERITTTADVYQFVERLKTASQQDGAVELNRQLDHATRLGSSSLEMLGAIRQAVVGNLSDVERLLAGQRITPALAAKAGEAAVAGAQPLAKNAYKVPLTKALVRRTLLALATRA